MIRYLFASFLLTVSMHVNNPPDDESKKDLQKLQGTWRMVYSDVEGKGFKPSNVVRISFEKSIVSTEMGGETPLKCSVTLDTTKTPKRIDYTILENSLIPESKGTVVRCIYEFDNTGHLKIRHPDSGFPWWRPTTFSTKNGWGTLQ